MRKSSLFSTAALLVSVIFSSFVLTGCAAALIGAGAVGGYAIAKNMDSNNPPPKPEGNKGWFGGK
jgi:hypothetical protein